MTRTEQTLYNWLHQACALLAVEMRDHRENQQWDRKKRQGIANTLQGFLTKAGNVLDTVKDEAA